MRNIIWTVLTLTILVSIACTKNSEVIREIEYRILQDSTQKAPISLGGVKIKFRYCTEFAFDIDSILPEMEIQIPFIYTTYISTIDEEGKWFLLEGLQPSGIYSADVMSGGVSHYKYRFSGSGNNDYYYLQESMPLIESSKSQVESVIADFEYDSIVAKVLSFQIDVNGQLEDTEYDNRGAVVFISDEPNPNEENALMIRNYVTSNNSQSLLEKTYSGEIRINKFALEEYFQRGQTIYYTVHGVSGHYSYNNEVVKYETFFNYPSIVLDEKYSNKNSKSITGQIEME